MQYGKETEINETILIYKSVGKLGGVESVYAVYDSINVTMSWGMTPCNFAAQSNVSNLTVDPEGEEVHYTDCLCVCTNYAEQNYSRV